MINARVRLALSIVACIAAYGVAECAFRMRPLPELPSPPPSVSATGLACVASDETLWTLAENVESPRSDRGIEILVCGEDDACGVSAERAETWPAILETMMRRAVGTDAVNVSVAAAPGFTALQGELRLERELEERAPQIVLLQFGSANEFDPPLDGRNDDDWLGTRRRERVLGSETLAAIRRLFDYGAPRPTTSIATARVDVATYERALERMIRSIRDAGACPVVVAPIRRSNDLSATRTEAIGALYRAAARRVASVYGVPFVALDDALAIDRNPLRATSRHLSPRGARVVAQECLRTLVSDSAILLSIQHWLERHTSDGDASLIAGSFGLLHTIYREGPAARTPDTAIDLLERSLDNAGPELKPAISARLAIARCEGEAYEPLLEWMDAAAAASPRPDPLLDLLRGALRTFTGDPTGARTILEADDLRTDALARVFVGISYLAQDPGRAMAEFERANELDPALGFTDLWRAKAALLAGESWNVSVAARLAKVAIECHGAGLRSLSIPTPESGGLESFLTMDPVLFGIDQRKALPRLLLAFWIESVTRRRGIEVHLDRALILRDAGREDLATLELTAARDLLATSDPDAALNAAEFALRSGLHEVARAFATYALDRLDGPEAPFTMGVIELESNSPRLAVSLFERANALRPRDAKILYYLARARLDSGDPRGAAAAAREAVELWPDSEVKNLLQRAEAAIPR